MGGSVEGGKKTFITITAMNPTHYKEIGAKGGLAKVKKGFAMMSPEKRREAGVKGGTHNHPNKGIRPHEVSWHCTKCDTDIISIFPRQHYFEAHGLGTGW